ncbi:MAG: CAP domain-containing protein [Planctomycetaceae bacterium]|nr:CAP domain-containing protein [Planctomycetaceae bacterium]
MNCRYFLAVAIMMYLGMRSPLSAQTAEESTVITLSSEDVGPFRPEERPQVEEVEELIIQQTNEFRNKHELRSIKTDERLQQTALSFAQYMARTDRYGHQADGHSPAERVRAMDYPLCLIAENIAYYFATQGFQTDELATKVVDGWINSPPHRKNMLREHVTEIGVAVAQSKKTGVFYAVQLFGRPQSESIQFKVRNAIGETVSYQLGEQSFNLPPGYTRTHEMCVPKSLSLTSDKHEAKTWQPQSGNQFDIRRQDSEIVLVRQTRHE